MGFQRFSRIFSLDFQRNFFYHHLQHLEVGSATAVEQCRFLAAWILTCALKKEKLMELFVQTWFPKVFSQLWPNTKATSIETAVGFGKVKSVVEGDLTAIGNISETMDWGGGGAGRRDGTSCRKTRELCSR